MQLTFKTRGNSQLITVEELNTFETLIGKTLPQDYRQHMLTYNGGVLEEDVEHINYSDSGGISSFHPIKYGYYTMEELFEDLKEFLPHGYIPIGKTSNGGQIIISLNNDNNYGNIKEWFTDGDTRDLSSSFTQLLNDMVPSKG
jgi:hypothetical protein